MRLAHCRSCDAPITWTITAATGKRMPVDADPVIAPRGFRLVDPDGAIVDLEELPEDVELQAVYVATPASGERLYVAHWATCEQADSWRRRN